MLCGSLDGRGFGEEWIHVYVYMCVCVCVYIYIYICVCVYIYIYTHTHICMAGFLCCSPESITTLLTGYASISNEKLKIKKFKKNRSLWGQSGKWIGDAG